MKKLAVGDSIACYWSAGVREVCVIQELIPGGYRVRSKFGGESAGSLFAHPKQCRRLVKKPRQPKRKEGRVECLLNIRPDGVLRGANIFGADAGETIGQFFSDNKTIRTIEINHGEIVLSREDLESAWREVGFITRAQFESLCSSLGLKGKAE